MNITVNGESRLVKSKNQQNSLKEIITQIGYHPQLVVVELNGLIINPKDWEGTIIADGDNLEIVTIVGGGSYS